MICKIFKRVAMGNDTPTENVLGYTICEGTQDILDFFKRSGISLVDYGYIPLYPGDVREELENLDRRINNLKALLKNEGEKS